MSTHEEFYNQWVEPQLEELRSGQKKILDCLRGKNSDPGVVDDVRDNTKFRKRFLWVIITIVAAAIVQTAVAVRQLLLN